MKKANKTRYAILGMLKDGSRTGYEIREIMEDSTVHFWQESDASLYPMLKLLAKEGKVASKSVFVGKRRKEVFTITEAGKRDFDEWFEMPVEPENRRHELLLKLFFTTESTQEEMDKHFIRYLRNLQETQEEYKRIERELAAMPIEKYPNRPFWMKTLKNGMAHVDLEIAWVEKQLQEGKYAMCEFSWRKTAHEYQ
jgi:DNA-binding PadR family transcriptional regulator